MSNNPRKSETWHFNLSRRLDSFFSSSPVRLLTAFVLAFIVLFTLPYLEEEIKEKKDCNPGSIPLYCQMTNSKLLGLIEGFSIVVLAILFILEASDRKKQLYLEFWKIIDAAQGVETSGARFHALEELNKAQFPMIGTDADGADLAGINLENAKLERASFRKTDLHEANLQKAILQKANLQGANLQKAQLAKSDLWLANLQEADLQNTSLQEAKLGGANLQKAILQKANLRGADLRGADLRGADLRGADLRGANLAKAQFLGVQNLSLPQVQSAKNWKEAIYDKTFYPAELGLIREENIEEVGTETTREDSAERQLLRLIYNLITTKELDKRRALAKVYRQIEEAIELLDSEAPVQRQDNLPVLEIQAAVEGLIERDNAVDESEKAQSRGKLADLDDNVASLREGENLKRVDLAASTWLASEREILKNRGVKAFIDRNSEMTLSGGKLDSPEKVERLYQDIDRCLDLIITCLSKSSRPYSEGVIDELPLAIPVYLDIFRIISAQVIPEIQNNRPDPLPDEVYLRLNGYLNYFMNELEQRAGSCDN